MLKETEVVTCTQLNGAIRIRSCKRGQRTETKVVRILIFGIVAVEVLVALFLVLLKKLHRHKLKTIFNFKMTELSNEAAIVLALLCSHPRQPFLGDLLPKMSQMSVETQCVTRLLPDVLPCFFLFFFYFFKWNSLLQKK